MSKPDGGPAFPVRKEPFDSVELGMSMRDYFAAAALPAAMDQANSVAEQWNGVGARGNAARIAYELADAMLAERAK